MFVALGGDVADDCARRWARQVVLHTAAATFDVFEQRLSHPPFTLFKLGDARLTPARRRSVATDFEQYPEHCLSSFCRRLREQFPNAHDMLERVPDVMHALAVSTPISIDPTERSHAQFRLDVRSTGKAANFTAAANRVWCEQLRAEHERRSGADPAKAPFDGHVPLPTPGSGGDVVAADQPPKRRKGGNARVQWQNFKLQQYKQRVAPSRALTDDELEAFY